MRRSLSELVHPNLRSANVKVVAVMGSKTTRATKIAVVVVVAVAVAVEGVAVAVQAVVVVAEAEATVATGAGLYPSPREVFTMR